jgi:hypothetical protein
MEKPRNCPEEGKGLPGPGKTPPAKIASAYQCPADGELSTSIASRTCRFLTEPRSSMKPEIFYRAFASFEGVEDSDPNQNLEVSP